MSRQTRIVFISIVLLFLGFLTFFLGQIILFRHRLNFGTIARRYEFFFKDSIKGGIYPPSSYSCYTDHDIYNHYQVTLGKPGREFAVTIWDFKDHRSILLKDIYFLEQPIDLKFKFGTSQIINADGVPEISMKYNFRFEGMLRINFGSGSKIDSILNSSYCKGFYGKITRMLFTNGLDLQIIGFNFTNKRTEYAMFVFYNSGRHLYLFIINSPDPFSPNELIKIFNLNNLKGGFYSI